MLQHNRKGACAAAPTAMGPGPAGLPTGLTEVMFIASLTHEGSGGHENSGFDTVGQSSWPGINRTTNLGKNGMEGPVRQMTLIDPTGPTRRAVHGWVDGSARECRLQPSRSRRGSGRRAREGGNPAVLR
ncbi:MAG: hypothetical protein QOF33_4061 [Thermomicrobiales bacterium]|jgi:hypothetical protein|nr:hypothetical protein [Thermomicrobiales bacterium]